MEEDEKKPKSCYEITSYYMTVATAKEGNDGDIE